MAGADLAAETLTFSAQRTEAVFAEGRELTRLRGSARVQTETVEIVADSIDIYGESQRYVESTGGVTVYDSENDLYLTCIDLFYDRELKFFRASGDAYLEDRGVRRVDEDEWTARLGVLLDRRRRLVADGGWTTTTVDRDVDRAIATVRRSRAARRR